MLEPAKKDMSAAWKALVGFAIGVLLGLGMCGVGGSQFSLMGVAVFVISVIGAIVTLLIILIISVKDSFSK
jgi:hypothetical protein